MLSQRTQIIRTIDRNGWALGRVMPQLNDPNLASEVRGALVKLRDRIDQQVKETPFGVPYRPNIWGAGWEIQSFGATQFFLHQGWPDIFDTTALLNALHFVLGCHPGENTASFVSGVGVQSLTVAYGTNRADWSYIPGASPQARP